MATEILSSIIRMTDRLSASLRRSLTGSSSSDPDEVEEHLKKLKQTFDTIETVIDDAEKREIREEAVKHWLRELKGVACDAEDVLDEIDYELLRYKCENFTPNTDRKRKLVEVQELPPSPFVEASFRRRIMHRIKEIEGRFDDIAKDRAALQLREGDGPRRQPENRLPVSISSSATPSEVYGREEDKKNLVEVLLSEDYNGVGVAIVPIVGMPGVGKTTLAQLVYNDPIVLKNFDTRTWVGVHENFDVTRLMKEIIESITKSSCELTQVSALQEHLKKLLQGKKFLLVLDDVWNEDQTLWERLSLAFSSGHEGSRIVVTTRNEPVARIMQSVAPIELKCLSDQDCWLLLKRCASEGRDLEAHPGLIEIGKMIADKCRGLPLAAKVLGGILCYEASEERWIDLLQSDLWDLEDEENGILPALKISYQHLPVHLKRCFVYCAVFPKGYVFKKDPLVRKWMVQGFLQTADNNGKEQEDVGSDYFDELMLRSFFQYSLLDIGEEEKFVMHDLVHDLARYFAGEECIVAEDCDLSNLSIKTRHLSLIPYGSKVLFQFKSADKQKPLRSLQLIYILANSWGGVGMLGDNLLHVKIPNEYFLNLICLRTLDLSYTDIEELPDSIGSLKHLRHLSLRNTKIQKLPESICRLYYLQTLELDYCSNLRELPSGIGNLTNLRHLQLPTMEHTPICMPSGFLRLTNLLELSAFNVGGDSVHCNIGELKDMADLRGDLHISGLRNVARGWDAEEANLKTKKNVQRLALDWYVHQSDYKCSHLKPANLSNAKAITAPWNSFEDDSLVLENLEPHHNLVVLDIRNYGGARLPKWLGDPSFSNLTTVRFFLCEKCEALPALGELPSLKNLHINGMQSVRRIGPEFYGSNKKFAALEKLELIYMPKLEEWDEVEEGAFVQLSDLIVTSCPKLKSLPKKMAPSLKKLNVGDCQELTAIPAPRSLISLSIGGACKDEIWSCLLDLPLLESLEVVYCEGLTSLPLHNMPVLKTIVIKGCSELVSIDCIASSSSSSTPPQVGLHNLISLEVLKFEECPMLGFPGDEQLPASLKEIDISCCPMLMKWCDGPEASRQLASVPNVIIEDYDQEEFNKAIMEMMDDESEADMEED
ncbi:putative disease resistance protein RGA3 [Typha angustifolia]|uniref:putative disease resistance protein RGA3 n=1 Tax=Typha angustifolia TaxID=59011 RepID=UPI003C2FA664